MNLLNQRCYWLRPKDIILLYKIKRTYLYKLIKTQKIETKLLSVRIRLISVKSLEDFINSCK